ncbi:MaoC family dehydratase [Dysgonomonas macrotermitis]|uniref:Acyl dehydratase n=1 Tax=Dysgonomonas macrotermitis TaxID=1346286 RepID=A0A1M5FTH2_9BACT|nr:MaoC family dehydratase [Dysgonomonas macrotermitis]SHF94867.1 Acyl dehydratase [Dysgonomonas macrotermitis]
MSKVIIGSFEEFEKYVGQELGVSDYLKIDQDRINLFADATLDHQWIHTDTERAKKESAFHSTIAHGYLTLSLLPYLWDQIVEVHNLKMMINYGMEKLKFNQAVVVDSEVRIRVKLLSLKNLRGTIKAEMEVVMEIKDSPKNAYETNVLFLYHFND